MFLVALAAPGCATASPSAGGSARVPSLPFVPSAAEDDCGVSALGAALARAGAPRPAGEIRAAIHDPARDGAPTSALVRYARAQDVFALARERWTLDELKAWVRAGVAPIVLLSLEPLLPPSRARYHYALLKGFDDGERRLVLQDGREREVALDYDDFFPRWCAARGFALVVCEPAIEPPPPSAGGPALTAHELGALGWLAERKGALPAARRHYRAALALDSGFAAAAHNLANVESLLARP